MNVRYVALVPAAGHGTRFGTQQAKQYASLAGRPMIFHALAVLLSDPRVARVFVALAADDTRWESHNWEAFGKRVEVLRCGGATRAETVLNSLELLQEQLAQTDWVLVHDAARPCLPVADLSRLIDKLGDAPIGGLLAAPLADTLKRADTNQSVAATLPRDNLWRAQTPQMFRFGILRDALRAALSANAPGSIPTDEAGAIEALGHRPELVAGSARNIKVTYPEDLAIAELFLSQGTP